MQDLPRIETSIKIAAVSYAGLTAELVSAYVSNNPIRPADLSELIASVHKALSSLGASAKPAVEQVEKPTPAQIRKSVTPKGIVSFLDGKPYKTMKRHLTAHGLNSDTYRERFGLPGDYPMVAAGYAAQRSALAKSIGLGQPRSRASEDAESESEPREAPKRRGRSPKVA